MLSFPQKYGSKTREKISDYFLRFLVVSVCRVSFSKSHTMQHCCSLTAVSVELAMLPACDPSLSSKCAQFGYGFELGNANAHEMHQKRPRETKTHHFFKLKSRQEMKLPKRGQLTLRFVGNPSLTICGSIACALAACYTDCRETCAIQPRWRSHCGEISVTCKRGYNERG